MSQINLLSHAEVMNCLFEWHADTVSTVSAYWCSASIHNNHYLFIAFIQRITRYGGSIREWTHTQSSICDQRWLYCVEVATSKSSLSALQTSAYSYGRWGT